MLEFTTIYKSSINANPACFFDGLNPPHKAVFGTVFNSGNHFLPFPD